MPRSRFMRIGQLAPGHPLRVWTEQVRSAAGIAGPARSAFARSRDYPRDSKDGYSDAVSFAERGGGMLMPGGADLAAPGAAMGPGGAANPDLDPAFTHSNIAPSTMPPASPVFDELRFADFANFGLAPTNASARILVRPPADAKRVYFFFVNTDAVDTLYLAFGKDADAVSGLPIQPNFGFVEWAVVVPQNDIYCISSAAASTAVMLFSNKGAPNLAGVALRAPLLEQLGARNAPAPAATRYWRDGYVGNTGTYTDALLKHYYTGNYRTDPFSPQQQSALLQRILSSRGRG